MFYENDYLRGYSDYTAKIIEEKDQIVLTNGIAERRFILAPDLACVSIKNLYSGEQFLRSIQPEVTVTVDGGKYPVGGAAATIEPLCEHLDHYRLMPNNNLMAGVQASYRGVRLYDTEATMQMVKNSVDTYKAHRTVFESPIVHIHRPDGRNYDGYIHVDPESEEKGMLVLFNPLDEDITRTVRVPLYYTGIENKAVFSLFDNAPCEYTLNRDNTVTFTCTIPANDFVWFTVKQK